MSRAFHPGSFSTGEQFPLDRSRGVMPLRHSGWQGSVVADICRGFSGEVSGVRHCLGDATPFSASGEHCTKSLCALCYPVLLPRSITP